MIDEFAAPQISGNGAHESYLLWHALFTWRIDAPLHKASRHRLDNYAQVHEAEIDRHEQWIGGSLR